jgi:hypothetical protein
VILLWNCSGQKPQNAKDVGVLPPIFPAENGATIPCNIAPINFMLNEPCDRLFLSIKGKNTSMECGFDGDKSNISVPEWTKFLAANKGDSIYLTVYARHNNNWIKYKPLSYLVSPDAIDEYLVYRLIHPGYQTWNTMGIYQRNLSGFKEPIIDSKFLPQSCMNCHAMANNNPDHMMIHIRENNAGTFLISGNKIEKLNTKTPNTFSSVSFPNWHPSAKYIAYSINKVRQLFPSVGEERAHAYDGESDMVIYDVDKNVFFTSPLLFSKDAFESSPCFSPDGKILYFITAKAVQMPKEEKNIRYSLCSIAFDAASATIGTKVDTLISASRLGKSVAFPRVSPNGKHIMVTITDHGNFPAYNKDADLYMFHLADSTLERLDVLNSNDVESYHSWSSTGRWVVFSSRRMDGLYMNAYIAHVDENGNPEKPFLLPQEDAGFHKNFLYSFNIPEFAVKKVNLDRYEFEKVAKQSNGSQVSFESYH